MTRTHTILFNCIGLVALLVSAGSAMSQTKPAQPGASNYTVELTPFAEHTGENAIDLTHAGDGSGRIFVSTQSGRVFAFDRDGKSLGVFLDLAGADVGFTFDAKLGVPFKGLMYIAFHPDYGDEDARGYGRFYTGHQVEVDAAKPDFDSKAVGGLGDSDVRFMLAEWRVDPDNPDRIDPASHRRVMLLHFHSYGQMPHALGELAFNPYANPGEADYGKLYIAVGDSHNGDYKQKTNLARTQLADNPFAKILRIDPLADGDAPYTIPADNPFVVGGQPTEAYAIGLRDAQSFSFARGLDGETVILAFDIGALAVEEINIVRAGGNYGWDRYEGLQIFDESRQAYGEATPPAVQYGHAFPTRLGEPPEGGPAAIIGGFVVSDPEDPSFRGQVLFADLPRGTLMHANYHHMLSAEREGTQSTPYILNARLGEKTGNFADVIGAGRGDSRFGVDESGAVYIVSKQTGMIFKTNLVYTGEPVKSPPTMLQADSGRSILPIAITFGMVFVLIGGILLLTMFLGRVRRD